ncbi:GNAT family N-acetyltransferase [Alicyclobacillus sp. SO9]|uniref:GNAT family N-acetyltransferase n=1 Tax=Alicyclobacillus sp. SO9 TaxID=2665646 RepID=UPI0018E8216C|nr:GNAT family N-acetyltransferase [Alicyclobacillus sp. SO9]QQE77114.1 hypothetical protein GI364_14135 [Alicyclobacillus sp. SO9]
MKDEQRLLQAYDRQLRTDAETQNALSVTHLGPLHLATLDGGQGFVTYPHPDDFVATQIPHLVPRVLDYYRQSPIISQVEWKTRGHDRDFGLHQALVGNGFQPDNPESIMIGEAKMLDVRVPLPAGVALRCVTEEADIRAMTAMESLVFRRPQNDMVDALLRRLALGDGMQLWVAEADGEVISAGRLEPVAGTNFAGIWGGATLEAWRGRGIYRALTATRSRAALDLGKTLIYSESTEYSRPILERSGLVKVSTTTPYRWYR